DGILSVWWFVTPPIMAETRQKGFHFLQHRGAGEQLPPDRRRARTNCKCVRVGQTPDAHTDALASGAPSSGGGFGSGKGCLKKSG
ncbi:MAG: hypothetical protein IJS46_03210, partial [Kiritimatiellae bacterium]|nr:hypothetical protein [Kiritimatiellia bacterium]